MKILHSVRLTLQLSMSSIICYACMYVHMASTGDGYRRPKHVNLICLSFFLSLALSIYSLWLWRVIGTLITLKDIHTFGRTPLEEGSARRRDLHLTTNNTHERQTSMSQRNLNPQPQQASGCRPILRPRGHWDRSQNYHYKINNYFLLCVLRWFVANYNKRTVLKGDSR
jgi:hypothetical protein